jgi:hypothetical protein
MNGLFGFLENSTGQHIQKTIEALSEIGAPESAAILDSVKKCMDKHNVIWMRLRGDFEDIAEHEISSSRKIHGYVLDSFYDEVTELAGDFSVFNSSKDTYSALVDYLEGRAGQLQNEINKRLA